ncbi:MAG: DUF5687 family protein [Bacteroidales bacterium]|nr:DUF5687 family protein [Bacteroidales bacterium]
MQFEMTDGLKELFRLWRVQKKRDFSWRTFFVGLFLFLYFVLIVGIIYAGFRDQLSTLKFPFAIVAMAPLLAVSVVPADLMVKIFWRRSPVEMDDYLRTRPVLQRDWSRFILFDTAVSFLQWMFPVTMAFVAALLMPWWTALLTLVLTFSCTMVNALLQNAWRRAPGNQWTLPLVFAYLFWLFLAFAVAVVGFTILGLQVDDPETLSRPLVLGVLLMSAVLLVINLCAGAALQWYFGYMRNHNEEMHAPVHASARKLGEVSLWSIEWVQLLRSKRLRVSAITIAVVFVLNVYLQQMTSQMEADLAIHVNPMLMFAIGMPSLILAQWVLGVEANFFSGIWTKPWSVEGILRRKYLFYCGLCGLMALLILPAVAFMGLSFLAWLAALLFSCGIFVLPFMATCLFSSRMDLFASAFFNYQGANKQINVFSFILFIPMGIYFALYILLPPLWAHLSVSALGLMGFALHRWYIGMIAQRWFNKRYEIMERWQNE